MPNQLKYIMLVLWVLLIHEKTIAGGYGLANIKYAIELKTARLEIVLSDELSTEISDHIQSSFKDYWNYSEFTFISFSQYQKQKSEAGHFYFVGNKFSQEADYMTYGILRFREIDYSQKNKDSLNGFNIIASGMSGVGAVNTLIMSPYFHTEDLIDPLNMIIMRDYLFAIWNNKEALKLQEGIFSNLNTLKIINEGSTKLLNKKLLIPLFPETDTLKINYTGKIYNTPFMRENYLKHIGFINASAVNFKLLSENTEFKKSAVLINLFHFSDSYIPSFDLKPVVVYDIETEKIIAFILINSPVSPSSIDLKKLSKLSDPK